MATPPLNLKVLIAIQVLVGATLALGSAVFGGLQLAASVGIGALLMLANLLLHAWTWSRLLDKKSFAWTLQIIVIKYAVLLGSIFYLMHTGWFQPLGAGLGIASFTIAALIFAICDQKKEINTLGSNTF